MPRHVAIMLLIVGVVAATALRAHHCRGAVGVTGVRCEHVADVTISQGTTALRVHTVLSDRTPGSIGACSVACGPSGSERPAFPCESKSESASVPGEPGAPGAPECPDAPVAPAPTPAPAPFSPHHHEHAHVACIDALPLTTAPVMDGAAAPLFFMALMVELPFDGPEAVPAARPQIERRGGDPPPGLRSTRIQV